MNHHHQTPGRFAMRRCAHCQAPSFREYCQRCIDVREVPVDVMAQSGTRDLILVGQVRESAS